MGTVARLLADHVTLRVRAVDRVGVAVYVLCAPHKGGLVEFVAPAAEGRRRNIPSPSLRGHNHDRMVADWSGSSPIVTCCGPLPPPDLGSRSPVPINSLRLWRIVLGRCWWARRGTDGHLAGLGRQGVAAERPEPIPTSVRLPVGGAQTTGTSTCGTTTGVRHSSSSPLDAPTGCG